MKAEIALTRAQEVLYQATPEKVEKYLWLARQQPRDEDRYQLRLRMVKHGMNAYQAVKDWFGTGLSSRASTDGLYYIARQVEDDIIDYFGAPSVEKLAFEICRDKEVTLGLKAISDVRRIMEVCREQGVETTAIITIMRRPP